MSLQHKKWEKTTSRRQYGIKNYFYSDSLTRPRNVKNKYVILRHLGDVFIHLGASVNKSHIPSLPQNNLYVLRGNFFQCHIFAMRSKPKIQIYSRADIRILGTSLDKTNVLKGFADRNFECEFFTFIGP
jgi:hypothetical protein